jgi:Arc/MetJ family transcription regulator
MSRTNIVIDDKLVHEAIRMTGAKTKREAVDVALRRLVEKGTLYRKLRGLKGKLHWDGDLVEMRKSRI